MKAFHICASQAESCGLPSKVAMGFAYLAERFARPIIGYSRKDTVLLEDSPVTSRL
jgi:hypothetical protein